MARKNYDPDYEPEREYYDEDTVKVVARDLIDILSEYYAKRGNFYATMLELIERGENTVYKWNSSVDFFEDNFGHGFWDYDARFLAKYLIFKCGKQIHDLYVAYTYFLEQSEAYNNAIE